MGYNVFGATDIHYGLHKYIYLLINKSVVSYKISVNTTIYFIRYKICINKIQIHRTLVEHEIIEIRNLRYFTHNL